MSHAANHHLPLATSDFERVPIIEEGPMMDRGYSESVKTMRGVLIGLAVVAPFWAAVLGGIALATH